MSNKWDLGNICCTIDIIVCVSVCVVGWIWHSLSEGPESHVLYLHFSGVVHFVATCIVPLLCLGWCEEGKYVYLSREMAPLN